MPDFSIFSLGVVLLTASLVAIVSRRLKMPYTVGLVIAGIALALLPNAVELPLTRDLIFNVLLPPLIFEAALHLKWKEFHRDLPLTTTLALPGVVIAAVASLSAGLLVGNFGMMRSISEDSRGHVMAFQEYAAFLANSVVFILIGSQEAHQHLTFVVWGAAAAILFVLAGRALAIYPLCAAFSRSKLRIDIRYQHVLIGGGLRGALALALALTLPANIPEREEIIAVVFAVVAFSIFVQGLPMPWLIRRLQLLVPR